MTTDPKLSDWEELLDFDRRHLWHPYTSMINPLPVYGVESAAGVRIRLADGRELIDGMASWWSAIHGYGHPRLVGALQEQAASLSHVMFGGLGHKPAVELGRRLVDLTPAGLEKVFFCDSGSVAVEVAMKMALQYHHALGNKDKHQFATIRSGYHGDTFHAMSVCDPVTGMHYLFSGVLPRYHFVPRPESSFGGPWHGDEMQPLRKLLADTHRSLCALILEPIVQGAGGMRFYHPRYLQEVRDLCDRYDVLLICDEIATGFGRSGKMFASEHSQVVPDILCLGKALTGGMLSLAATLSTDEVARTISTAEPGVFMHGPTFMANPLACRVASESIDLLLESGWRQLVANIERRLEQGLQPCRSLDQVADVRCLGAIGVVELHKPVSLASMQERFVDRGVWVRPFGTLVYVMPPYCIASADLDHLCRAVVEVVALED
ncbi:MAG: adenosylmethionine--8-amino-7-oxononanoate transaminase [Desulfofustis sp.]|jgi:adenosylmethionine---8-amino-7-oxononanoate aminotransferase